MRDEQHEEAPAACDGGCYEREARGGDRAHNQDDEAQANAKAIAPDPGTMRRFLKFIADAYYESAGRLEVAWDDGAPPPAKASLCHARLLAPTDIDDLVAAAVTPNENGRCVYVGPSLRCPDAPPNKRGSKKTVLAARFAWVDFDANGALDSALAAFDAAGTTPHWVTVTGEIPHRRGQCFWLHNGADQDANEKLCAAIAARFCGDASVKNADRVMRLAGGLAWPRKDGRVLELTRAHSERTNAPPYVFANLQRLLAPPRVNGAARAADENTKHKPNGGGLHLPHPDQAWANAALESACAVTAGAAVGKRNATLNAEAFGLGQIVGQGLLDKNVVESRLRTAARQCGLDDGEIDTVIPRAIEDGMKKPRGPAEKHDDADADTRPLELLEVAPANLPKSASKVIRLLSQSANLFDRDGPVTLSRDASRGAYTAHPLTAHGVARETHAIARPFVWVEAKSKEEEDGTKNGSAFGRKFVTLPERVCLMALDDRRAWRLRRLDGFASAPLLTDDGGIRTAEGYDPVTRMFCHDAPSVDVPDNPTEAEAKAALLVLRKLLRTFAFADAIKAIGHDGVVIVDLGKQPGEDESAALHALLTSVCRACLWTAPMLVVTAPTLSGAGAGKGKLVRVICAVAFGAHPSAVTAGHDANEMDKRIVGALVRGEQVVFLDNLNGRALKSDTLASAITERPAKLRIMGTSRLVEIAASAFIAVTGNGLIITEDLARRVLHVVFDSGVEDPEARIFTNDAVADAFKARAVFLSAALTIWRWGRQTQLKEGKAIGSFEQWARWVRDPLVALGCRDPADRIATTKLHDPRRAAAAELFMAWEKHHADTPVSVAELHEDVKDLIDPAGRGRHYQASRIRSFAGTRAAGFVLIHSPSTGKWSADKYKLKNSQRTQSMGPIGPIGGPEAAAPTSVTPMAPMGADPRKAEPSHNGDDGDDDSPPTAQSWEGSI